MKKKWDKPELTVLVRGNAEEAVLTGCKSELWEGPNVTGAAPHGCQASCDTCHAGLARTACSAVVAS